MLRQMAEVRSLGETARTPLRILNHMNRADDLQIPVLLRREMSSSLTWDPEHRHLQADAMRCGASSGESDPQWQAHALNEFFLTMRRIISSDLAELLRTFVAFGKSLSNIWLISTPPHYCLGKPLSQVSFLRR